MNDLMKLDIQTIIDLLSDGVYVADRDRRIVYWSKSAERITGWSAAEIVGRCCYAGVLCHVDKDGHMLCSGEYCPLSRAMVTGSDSLHPLIYVQCKDGRRIPTQAQVAPIRNAEGEVIGGVETFRDVSQVICDLERSKAIQTLSLRSDLPPDPRIRLRTHYLPHDILGGDYYALKKLDDDRYGFFLADVMGHGISAALYTMYLSSLWTRFLPLLTDPPKFANSVNRELNAVVRNNESFAAASCGVIDLEHHEVRITGVGGPPILLLRGDGTHTALECPGLPLGIVAEASYDEKRAEIARGDRLLLFTDGAIEIADAAGEMLGVEGLARMARQLGEPESSLNMAALAEALLLYSNSVRLEDDLTLLEIGVV